MVRFDGLFQRLPGQSDCSGRCATVGWSTRSARVVGSILDVGLWGGIWGLVVGVHPLARGLRAKGSAVAFANSEKAKWAVAEVSCALVYLASGTGLHRRCGHMRWQ